MSIEHRLLGMRALMEDLCCHVRGLGDGVRVGKMRGSRGPYSKVFRKGCDEGLKQAGACSFNEGTLLEDWPLRRLRSQPLFFYESLTPPLPLDQFGVG